MRSSFDTLEKAFDLSQFYNDRSGNFFSKRRDVMNSVQLMVEIDTFSKKVKSEYQYYQPGFYAYIDNKTTKSKTSELRPERINDFQRAERVSTYSNTYAQHIDKDLSKYKSFVEIMDSTRKSELLDVCIENIGYQKNLITNSIGNIERYKEYRDYWVLGLHQQYSYALICIVFLFIGAPLGSIIRKGGYGVPVLIAIMFFMIFILLTIMGEKLNRASVFNPIVNAWLPVIVLLPISIYISIRALADSGIIFVKSK